MFVDEVAMQSITPERVHEIVAMDDQPVLRNLLITDSYHRLTLTMTELLGRDDFTWPIFATWASKHAGSFIRQEEVPVRLRATLGQRGDDVELFGVARAILDGVTRFIIGGNIIVFEELGEAFARFAASFAEPAARTEENLADLIARYTEGEIVPDTVEVSPDGKLIRSNAGGQRLIRSALSHYFAALHEPNVNARSELVLLANVECGLHEQIRLQPYIAGALESPVEVLLRLASGDSHPLADELAAVVRRVCTELLMTLPLPHQLLRLGGDLPAPPGLPMWPPELDRLENSTLLELAAQVGAYDVRERELALHDRMEGWINPLLAKLGLAELEAQGTGAGDWASLPDRMRFVFEYFRSRQRDAVLLTPPFSPEQQAAYFAGHIPDGPL
jgi:hypothetical protein